MAPIKSAAEAASKIDVLIEGNHIVVFSKIYCPFCNKVKDLFRDLGAKYFAVELDELDGDEGRLIQSALKTKTGQSTVPNVFIGKKHIGGCDDTFRQHKNGKLVPLLGNL